MEKPIVCATGGIEKRESECCGRQKLDLEKPTASKTEVGANEHCGVRYHKAVKQLSSSEATARNIRVRVQAQYDPRRSSPQQSQWFFLYTVSVTNEGHDTVQLISRR